VSIFHRLFGPGAGAVRQASDNRITTSQDLASVLWSAVRQSASGINVTHAEALKCPAVKVSIKIISESVAQLPFGIIRQGSEGKRDVAVNNPVHRLLSTSGKPNGWQSSFEFRRLMTRWVAFRGNAYALKQTVNNTLDALLPLHPARVRAELESDGRIYYYVQQKDGRVLRYEQQDMFHLRGETDDGITGIDPIRENAEAIGLALAQDRFAALLFGNGAKPSGTIEIPGALKEEPYKRLKDSFDAAYTGLENTHKVILLEDGAKFNTISPSGTCRKRASSGEADALTPRASSVRSAKPISTASSAEIHVSASIMALISALPRPVCAT